MQEEGMIDFLQSLTELEVMGSLVERNPWNVCFWVPMERLGNLGLSVP
jgi:hypothetical protein